MKKQSVINHIVIITSALFVLLHITSCKKTSKGTSTGTFYFHLHTNIDTNEVEDATTLYTDANGRHFGLSVAQFYISNVVMTNVNGTTYTIRDARILKAIDSEVYLAGTAPVGTYNSVTFDVGLDDATNAMTPSAFSTTGYTANTDMWFGNTTKGFMFMKIQGIADTTAAQSGTNLVHFSYEIGSSANRKSVTMPTRTAPAYPPYILTAGSTQYIHLTCDYGKLLSVVNFKTQDSTDSYSINPTIATTIANNIPNLFRYED